MRLAILNADTNAILGELVTKEKKFKTGSRGFMAFGKIHVNGKRYQVTGNLVEIGSKNGSK